MSDSEKTSKKEGKFSKLILGMIVGGAVGSVVGVTLSDKKRREKIKKTSVQAFNSGKQFFSEYAEKRSQKSESKTGFWHALNRFFHGDKK